MWWWAIAYCFYVFIGAYLCNLIHSQTSIVDGSCLPTMQCRFTCISIMINIILVFLVLEVCVSVQCKIMFFFTIIPMISDIDECASSAHNCDSSATCTNTVGSFTCACNAGFYGNGTSCQGEELYALHGTGASDWLIACDTKLLTCFVSSLFKSNLKIDHRSGVRRWEIISTWFDTWPTIGLALVRTNGMFALLVFGLKRFDCTNIFRQQLIVFLNFCTTDSALLPDWWV